MSSDKKVSQIELDPTHSPSAAIQPELTVAEAHPSSVLLPEVSLSDVEFMAMCKEHLCAMCEEKAKFDDQRLRNLAEMDNFKKRLVREQEEIRKYAVESVLADLLPILDNLELAIEHGRRVEACQDVVLGVDMTRRIFLDTLSRYGVSQVGEEGEAFDPALHEAVAEEVRSDLEEGTICRLIQRGYLLRERLLRPARVTVSKAE